MSDLEESSLLGCSCGLVPSTLGVMSALMVPHCVYDW